MMLGFTGTVRKVSHTPGDPVVLRLVAAIGQYWMLLLEKRECPLRLVALTDARVVISLVAKMVDRAVSVFVQMSVASRVVVVMVEGKKIGRAHV
jgi:hypothetical protein